jgi:hypothetical protein
MIHSRIRVILTFQKAHIYISLFHLRKFTPSVYRSSIPQFLSLTIRLSNPLQFPFNTLIASLSRTLKHLLETVLTIRIRLLQIILLLIQIPHLLCQRLTLLLEPLLHIWDGCANKPNWQQKKSNQ